MVKYNIYLYDAGGGGMKKKFTAVLLIMTILLCGCGGSVSQEEYQQIIAERDAYKAEVTRLLAEKEIVQETEQNSEENKNINEVEETFAETTLIENIDVLQAGTYIIGEDIEYGKYNFCALTGTGTLRVYKSYEDYRNDKYGYDAFREFDMLADGASVGLLNQDIYTDFVFGIKLDEGYCVVIDKGLQLEYFVSTPVKDSILNVGVYVVGEDIKSGKFDFTAIKGSGSCKIYNSYDEYVNDQYGYDAFEDYDMKEENASVGMRNEDVYSQSISNIRLEDGQCLVIEKGLKIEYIEK